MWIEDNFKIYLQNGINYIFLNDIIILKREKLSIAA